MHSKHFLIIIERVYLTFNVSNSASLKGFRWREFIGAINVERITINFRNASLLKS